MHSACLYSERIIVIAIVMFLLRALPFWIFSGKRRESKLIEYLGKVLPYAAIGMLVVYCFKNVSFTKAPHGIPEVAAAAVTAALYAWKRKTLISIFTGTVLYMLMIQFIFV